MAVTDHQGQPVPICIVRPELPEECYAFGDWKTESESVSYFDSLFDSISTFRVYREITGKLIDPRAWRKHHQMRIDRILVPTQQAIDCGWNAGPIGVECKASGVKLNMALAQALDYSMSVFRLHNGFQLTCNFNFIWPFKKCHGFAASYMAQNRIGTIDEKRYQGQHQLVFRCGESTIMKLDVVGDRIEQISNLGIGEKTGSR